MNFSPRKNQGLVGIIILIIIALIILGYFGFDVRKIIESPQVQDNLHYVWGIVSTLAHEVWNIITSLWYNLKDFLKTLADAVSGWGK